MDRLVISWSFLERFWDSFWCFVYFDITLAIVMHEGLCSEFAILGLMVELLVVEKGPVAAIELLVWLVSN